MPLGSSSLTRVAKLLITLSALSLTQAGCSGASSGKTNPILAPEGPVKPVQVSDDAFASSLLELLADGTRSPKRDALLAGVVKRQLTHAQERFAQGQPERATESVLGALYLARMGEAQAAMLDETGIKALDGAIRFLSTRGDEGRVHALMRMRNAATTASTPKDAAFDEHLGNLERWLEDTHAGTEGAKLGSRARYLVARATLEPDPVTTQQAADAIAAWITRGLEIEKIFRQTGKRPSLAEAMEVERSSTMGPLMLAALYLRHGDAEGALSHIDDSSVRLRTPPILRRALIGAAEDGDARAWEMLAAIFAHESAPKEDDDDDRGERIDPKLIESALFGCVVEAYRLEPAAFAAVLAEELVKLGLPEGAPAVLARGLGEKPGIRDVASALRIVFEALALDADNGSSESAHRVFRAALPLLSVGDKPEYAASGIEPSPSRLRLLMASIELRTGDLASARPLYVAVAKADPSVSAWHRVARTDRQAGDLAAALENLKLARSAPDARVSQLDLVETNLLAFEIHRDEGRTNEAEASLANALATALASRSQRGDLVTRVRAETLLGRALEGYDDPKAARRAYERALTLASQDRSLFGATMLTVISRALVRRDLDLARAALHQGLDADLDQEERIYGGLWVMLLEKLQHTAPDGLTERALAPSGDRDAWVAKLASFATGKMTEDALALAAQNPPQKVEAEFYVTMLRKTAGDSGADARLRKVANSPVLDLVEIELARDLLAKPLQAKLPPSLTLP